MFCASNFPRKASVKLNLISALSISKRFFIGSFGLACWRPFTVTVAFKNSTLTRAMSVRAPKTFCIPITSAFFASGFLKVMTARTNAAIKAAVAKNGTSLNEPLFFFTSLAMALRRLKSLFAIILSSGILTVPALPGFSSNKDFTNAKSLEM